MSVKRKGPSLRFTFQEEQKMHVKHIEVENYRGIEKLELDFQEGINLLIGNNGAGKTTLLNAIGILASQAIQWITGISRMEIGNDAYMTTEVVGDAVVQNTYHYPIRIQGTINYLGKDYICSQEKKSEEGGNETNHFELAQEFTNLLTNTNVKYPLLCFIQAGREHAVRPSGNTVTIAGNESQRTDGYREAFGEKLNLQEIQKWCLQMDFGEYQRKHPIVEYTTFKKIVQQFFERIDPQMQGNQVYYSSVRGSLVRFDGESEKSVYQLSDGYQALFCLIVELAYRTVVLNPSDEDAAMNATGIVMIDEIEMHLHPAWQWTILKALKETFPHVQFFISTHSPVVLSSAEDATIYLMKTPTAVEEVENAYGYEINDILTYLQGSKYQPERVTSYIAEADRLFTNGSEEDLNQLMDRAEKEFRESPQVLKYLRDYIEVNRWVEEE